MQKVITIPEEVVLDIQAKDISRTVAADIIAHLIEVHQSDSDTHFFNSEVYKEFEKRAEDKRRDWETAKYNMSVKYIPSDVSYSDWNLNYDSCELTIITDCHNNSCTDCNCKK